MFTLSMLVLGVVFFRCLGDGRADVTGTGGEEARTGERGAQKKGTVFDKLS